jgi:hypothetical protein
MVPRFSIRLGDCRSPRHRIRPAVSCQETSGLLSVRSARARTRPGAAGATRSDRELRGLHPPADHPQHLAARAAGSLTRIGMNEEGRHELPSGETAYGCGLVGTPGISVNAGGARPRTGAGWHGPVAACRPAAGRRRAAARPPARCSPEPGTARTMRNPPAIRAHLIVRPPWSASSGVAKRHMSVPAQAGNVARLRVLVRGSSSAVGSNSRAGSAARRHVGLVGRWSPRRRPPNRTCESPRIRLSMSTRSGFRCPLVQLALEVEYPLLRLIGAGQRSASVHRRAPPIQSCRVLTGPLRPVDGFPVLLGGSLLPRLLRVLRHAPTATADGAPAPNPPRRDRRAPPGRFPRSPSTGRQGRRPAVPRGHRRALPQHSTRPHPPDQQPSGRDGPERKPGPSTPTAHSRQFRGCRPVSGLQPLIRSPYAFLPCYRTRPAGGGPLLDCRGPLAARRRTSDVGAAHQLLPAVAAAGG